MQRYIYVHEHEYGQGHDGGAGSSSSNGRSNGATGTIGNDGTRYNRGGGSASTTITGGSSSGAGPAEQTSTLHDAEWWSTEARPLIQYVALWSAPDISSATIVRVLCVLGGSSMAGAKAVAAERTVVTWIASFVQEHGDWTRADFNMCRLLADCFEPNMHERADEQLSRSVQDCIRRAVAQNPPREAGESRRVYPLDTLDLRVLPESLHDDGVVRPPHTPGRPPHMLSAAQAAAAASGARNPTNTTPRGASLSSSSSSSSTSSTAVSAPASTLVVAKTAVPFSRFQQVFGSAEEAREEWELAEVADGVGEPYRGDSGFALQMYAVEISGRGKFKGQKRPLIFSVILDAGCAQRSVLQALYVAAASAPGRVASEDVE
jgi:hypothetical protein